MMRGMKRCASWMFAWLLSVSALHAGLGGTMVWYSVPETTIAVGDSLRVEYEVQNTGTVDWQPGTDVPTCGAVIDNCSWGSDHALSGVIPNRIRPGESVRLSGTSAWIVPHYLLPSTPGTYTFRLIGHCYAPGYGQVLMASSAAYITLTVTGPTSWCDGYYDFGYSGWRWLSWLGYYFDNGSYGGWVYSQDLGWLYPSGTSPASVWIGDTGLGWLWTSRDTYPFLYSPVLGTWLWYLKGSTSPRWFYNWSRSAWEPH
jgi:hypothetical protein